MQDGYRIFGNGKSSKTTNKNQYHKFPFGLGYPKPEGKDEGESYTLFQRLAGYMRCTIAESLQMSDEPNKGVRIKTCV